MTQKQQIVKLVGNYTAKWNRYTIDYESRRRGSPICDMARLMLAKGVDPGDIIRCERDGVCVLSGSVGRFASVTASEADKTHRSIYFKNWKPFQR